ncbi:MAG TPA: translation initiation factor IF-3 [Acidimicrobiales bacterium]|nr:translation initiation factor IF-3 [Acidimicrobiales bacterium]
MRRGHNDKRAPPPAPEAGAPASASPQEKRTGATTISADQPEHRRNDRIRTREVRLIDHDGTQLGIKPTQEALNLAYAREMDLVEVAPDANPPVCKIMDWNKFKYDMAQRAKEAKRKATTTTIKEMKYRVKIGPGDFDTKTRQVGRFLKEGHKVKVTIMFRGRENDHPELGMKILDRVISEVDPVAKVEASPKRDGRNMVMVLAPDKVKLAATAKALKAADKAEKAEKAQQDRAEAEPATVEPAATEPSELSEPSENNEHATPAAATGAGAEASTA